MEIGYWFFAADGFIVYAMGATEITFGPSMLEKRFSFDTANGTPIALLVYVVAAVS